MNTPFVFETEDERYVPEMEGYGFENEEDLEEYDLEDEVRDHRRQVSRPMPTRPRPAVRHVPRSFARPAVRRPFVPRPSSRFRPGVRPLQRPSALFRPVQMQFRRPGVFTRGLSRAPFRFGAQRPLIRRPLMMRPGVPFRGWPHRRWRPFLHGVNRFFPPNAAFGPQFDDGSAPIRSERLIRLIQSLLNQVNGSNLPVDGVMDGATLDAISQVPDAAAPAHEPAPLQPPPPVDPIAPPSAPPPEPAPTGEMEDFFNEPEFEDGFEGFENEYANEEAEITPEDISQLQALLSQAIGTPIESDGRMNFRTRRALRSFQNQSGLPGHGFFDRRTRRRLMSRFRRPSFGRFRRGGRRGPFFETELEFENEQKKPVLVWGSMPLPQSENGRYFSALAKLEKLIYSSGKRSDLRYLCWLTKLRLPNTDDRVIKWSRICPRTSGPSGSLLTVEPCEITLGMPIKQQTIERAFKSPDDVERRGHAVGIFTYVRSDIVVAVELSSDPLAGFRSLHHNVYSARVNLDVWANNPVGGSSAMGDAYEAILRWIRRKQHDKNSLLSC